LRGATDGHQLLQNADPDGATHRYPAAWVPVVAQHRTKSFIATELELSPWFAERDLIDLDHDLVCDALAGKVLTRRSIALPSIKSKQ
jgi:hypothetical protein